MIFSTLRNPVLIFCMVFFTHFFSKVSYITDSRWTLHSSWAIIHHQNLELDDFSRVIEQYNYYAIDNTNGHLYYYFPPGTPLLCVPFLIVLEKLAKHIYYIDVFNHLTGYSHQGMELFLAALFTALTVVILFYVLKQFKIEEWLIWLLIFVFAFGTSAWTVASRGLFSHGPSMLFLTSLIYSFNRSKRNTNWLWICGFLAAFLYLIRPTNSIVLIVYSFFTLWQFRFRSFKFTIPLALVLGLFFAYNITVYGHILSPYFQPSRLGGTPNFLNGFAGIFFSPNRGLFIFSPFILFVIPAIAIALKKRSSISNHYLLLASIVLLHSMLYSYVNNWYAGWCFGPRFFTDLLPALMILLAFGMQHILHSTSNTLRVISFSVFLLLGSISCFIHFKGANELKTEQWNYLPNNIDEHRERVWDWNDLQFLR